MSSTVPLFTAALSVFSTERQLHYKNKRLALVNAVDEAKRAKYPNYSKGRIQRAEKDLSNFDDSFAIDFGNALTQLLNKVTK